MKLIKAVRGTKDIWGEDAEKYIWVSDTAARIFSDYGYTFIKTPIFEETDLFRRGVGEGTDIVEKEMYTFLDKGDRSITLRPENTASVVRSYLENAIYAKEDISKFYYNGSMFRYERPQAGRQREFNQIGIEVLGDPSPVADAEVIEVGYFLLSTLGISDLEVKINSVGGTATRERYRANLLAWLEPHREALCDDCRNRMDTNPLRVLDCKVDACKNIVKDAPNIIDALDEAERAHYEAVKKYLGVFNIKFTEDPRLVRGLDYYSSMVFEIVTNKLGAQGAVLGGGRYDNLLKQLGDKDIPAVGFAAGVERIMMLLDAFLPAKYVIYVAWLGEKARDEAVKISQVLRNSGFKTAIDYTERSMKAHMKKADRLGVKFCVILGEDEINKNRVILKDFEKRTQEELPFNNVMEKIFHELKA
ncbi:MAG: histidine--tRNA ligase [Fusobacteriaceae bacterium]|jgi:histidyl-tRNA synthetase|nr:histidine--tRNA ligase [Fusobacteriaceae bacterium]